MSLRRVSGIVRAFVNFRVESQLAFVFRLTDTNLAQIVEDVLVASDYRLAVATCRLCFAFPNLF
jgi:hypothetical protein